MIISLILMTCLFGQVVILLGEIRCLSLLGLKGLKVSPFKTFFTLWLFVISKKTKCSHSLIVENLIYPTTLLMGPHFLWPFVGGRFMGIHCTYMVSTDHRQQHLMRNLNNTSMIHVRVLSDLYRCNLKLNVWCKENIYFYLYLCSPLRHLLQNLPYICT